MAKNTKDLKPDIVLKNYWRDNVQFADFFNAVLFQGNNVLKPEDLEDEYLSRMKKQINEYLLLLW